MDRKYILLTIFIVIAATIGVYTSVAAKHAKDDKINSEIDKLVQQTKIDTKNKLSAINTDIQSAKDSGNRTRMMDLSENYFDVESKRMGRVAALHLMPEIIEYNDLEDYLWNIRENRLNRSDFETVGLTVPKKWVMYSDNIERMNSEEFAIYSRHIGKINDMENEMR